MASQVDTSHLAHNNKRAQVVALCVALVSMCTTFVTTRIWVRWRLVEAGGLGWDDWTIIVAWAFNFAFVVDVILQTNYGLGTHLYDLPKDTNFSESFKLFYFGEIIYYIVVGITKLSILFLYLRLAISKHLRHIILAGMVIIPLSVFIFVVANVFQCQPINFAWDKSIPDGKCFNVTALFFANAGFNIASDIIIYVLPMPMLWKVQIPLRKRIALIIVFAIGGFVCVTGMIRLSSLKSASISSDATYDNVPSANWSIIESNVGIICACLPSLRPLATRLFPGLMGETPSGKPGSRAHHLRTASGGQKLDFGTVRRASDYDSDCSVELESGNHKEGWLDTKSSYNTAVVMGHAPGRNDSEEEIRGMGIYRSVDVTVNVRQGPKA